MEVADLAGYKSGAAGGYSCHPKVRALLRTKSNKQRADLREMEINRFFLTFSLSIWMQV